MDLESIAIVKGLFIVVNRVASWFGSGYFITKGFRQKTWHHIWVGIGISLVMFLMLVGGLKLIWGVDVMSYFVFWRKFQAG